MNIIIVKRGIPLYTFVLTVGHYQLVSNYIYIYYIMYMYLCMYMCVCMYVVFVQTCWLAEMVGSHLPSPVQIYLNICDVR